MSLSNQLKGIFLIWQEKPLVNYSPKAICHSLFLVIVFIILLAILRIIPTREALKDALVIKIVTS